jgi:hypothetical protein
VRWSAIHISQDGEGQRTKQCVNRRLRFDVSQGKHHKSWMSWCWCGRYLHDGDDGKKVGSQGFCGLAHKTPLHFFPGGTGNHSCFLSSMQRRYGECVLLCGVAAFQGSSLLSTTTIHLWSVGASLVHCPFMSQGWKSYSARCVERICPSLHHWRRLFRNPRSSLCASIPP